jgi:DNA-binding transcriptional regulator YiaG
MTPNPTLTPEELATVRWMRHMTATGVARSIRRAAGLSQREASRNCGLTGKSTLNHWESGTRVPHDRDALRYAELLTYLIDGAH